MEDPKYGRREKQKNKVFKLMLHGHEFNGGEELVINPELFPDVKVDDILEIIQPGRKHERLILQVASLGPVKGKLQVSILKDIAAQFQLEAFHNVILQHIDPRDVYADFIELRFKDQFLSHADIWRLKVAICGKALTTGKILRLLGMRAQVVALVSSGQNINCGVVGADTKFILRSCSARIFWLVQLSTEMWEFADDGEMYFEKFVEKFLGVLFHKWQAIAVSHALTVVFFSRCFYDKDQFPHSFDPTSKTFTQPNGQGHGFGSTLDGCAQGYGPTIHVDNQGRYYEDFYMVVVTDYTGPDWLSLIHLLKCKFNEFPSLHRWKLPGQHSNAEYIFKGMSDTGEHVVQWTTLPRGVPSKASEGNILEAINVCLTILEKHYMDRDLGRTGQSILMISAGSGVFKVPRQLAHITKQRMMDNGIGMDMLSLAMPPLHNVPLFIWQLPKKQSSTYSDGNSYWEDAEDHVFNIPHWINISFLDLDDCSQKNTLDIVYPQTVRKKLNFCPLPSYRMFDLTCPSEPKMFPVLLRCLLGKNEEELKEKNTTKFTKQLADPLLQDVSNSMHDFISSSYPEMSFDKGSNGLRYRSGSDYGPATTTTSEYKFIYEEGDDIKNEGFILSPTHSHYGSLPRALKCRSSQELISLSNSMIEDTDDQFTSERFALYDSSVFTQYHQHQSLLTRHQTMQGRGSPRKGYQEYYDCTTPTFNRGYIHRGRQTQQQGTRSNSLKLSCSQGISAKFGSSPIIVQGMKNSRLDKSNTMISERRRGNHFRSGTVPPRRCDSFAGDELLKSPDSSDVASNTPILSPRSLESIASDDNNEPTTPTPKTNGNNNPASILSRAFSSTSMLASFGSPAVNPFQGIPEYDVSLRLTSNRRRWSHLFPSTEAEFKLHAGPNWKSLVSPAALPLTTDYYPLLNDLLVGYTESFYALTLTLQDSLSIETSTIPAYTNHLQLVTEMVCQRLTGNFQLVAADAGIPVDSRTRVPTGSTKRGPGGESRDSHCLVYHLSMGHRIHQIIYDEELQTIEVKRYVKRMAEDDANQPYVYRYSLWVPQTRSFHPSLQEFYEYPTTEYNWNYLDQVLCGYYDEMPEQTKCRRIRFCILPPIFLTKQDEEEYRLKFLRFLEFLQAKVGKYSLIEVTLDSIFDSYEEKTNKKESNNYYERTRQDLASPCAHSSDNSNSNRIYKISLNNPNPSISKIRQEWIALVLDSVHHMNETYHFEFRWLACSGGVLMDFISSVYRKCQQIGVDLRRFPEYARVSYVQIHPLLAPVYLPIPYEYMKQNLIINSLTDKLDFIFDDCVLADSIGIGYGLGIDKLQYSTRQLSSEKKQRRIYSQYMHRTLPVFIRVMANGLLWLPMYKSGNMDDLFNQVESLIEGLVMAQIYLKELIDQVVDDHEERTNTN